jgi:hypothetical protein
MGRFALLVPPPLQGIILDFDWDRARLHALALPVDELALSELRWQLDLPWWRVEDRFFAVAPNQVRAEPARYAQHWQRTLAADLTFPIHVTETAPGRWTILDGVHRLLKADITGAPSILAKRVRDLEAIRIMP